MVPNIKEFVENNEVLKEYLNYTEDELEIIRLYIKLELAYLIKEEPIKAKTIRSCMNESYNYLDYMLSFKHKINVGLVSIEDSVDRIRTLMTCSRCKCSTCIKKTTVNLMLEVDKINEEKNMQIKYIDVIDYMLNKKYPEYKEEPAVEFFDGIRLVDLMYVQIILEANLISISKYDKKTNILEAIYLDLTHKVSSEYYINILYKFYMNKEAGTNIKLDLNNLDNIFDEKDEFTRIYKIACYYKYLMDYKQLDIMEALRKMLESENVIKGMKVRANYFIYKSFQKVEELPYSKKTKEKIYSILNYILNYRYKETTPYIPINILVYSDDKESVENISRIIGEFMWFFGYLADNMHYYSEYINNILLDKFAIKRLYYDGDNKRKNGILLIHNLENLSYTDNMQQNLILNILTDEMEKNNNQVCTIIYGNREILKGILEKHCKLSQMLINLELQIDDLEIDQIYKLLIAKLEKNMNISKATKEKIYNYIKATYDQSDTQNMEYVNRLYNLIVLNMHNTFSIDKKQELKSKDIPEAYNTRDLPTIMKDLNELVRFK